MHTANTYVIYPKYLLFVWVLEVIWNVLNYYYN